MEMATLEPSNVIEHPSIISTDIATISVYLLRRLVSEGYVEVGFGVGHRVRDSRDSRDRDRVVKVWCESKVVVKPFVNDTQHWYNFL